jgi:signal peptidase I
MAPTLQINDRVVVEKARLDLYGVNPRDMVVFDRPAILGPTRRRCHQARHPRPQTDGPGQR